MTPVLYIMTDYIKCEVDANGSKFYYLNDELHREDGPAIEHSSGKKYWWLNGKRLTEEEFNKRMVPTVEMTMDIIDLPTLEQQVSNDIATAQATVAEFWQWLLNDENQHNPMECL